MFPQETISGRMKLRYYVFQIYSKEPHRLLKISEDDSKASYNDPRSSRFPMIT